MPATYYESLHAFQVNIVIKHPCLDGISLKRSPIDQKAAV